MGVTGEVVLLFWLTVVSVGVAGVASGLLAYHWRLGWFISRSSRERLEAVVEDARRYGVARVERRHRRERRAQVLAAERVRERAGRHLSR